MRLYLDFETYHPEKDGIAAGVYQYARRAEPLLLGWAADRGNVRLVDFTTANWKTAPEWRDFVRHIRSESTICVAHNANFDRIILRDCLELGVPIERWLCTMVKSYAHAFPGALSAVGKALGLDESNEKFAEGRQLIRRFCQPAPANAKVGRYTKETHPEEWDRFCEYAKQDIVAMREIDRRLPNWNFGPTEQALWHLDQHINDRGIQIDTELVKAGERASTGEVARLRKRFAELTHQMVDSPSKRERFKEYLNRRWNLGLTDTRANTFKALLKERDDLHPTCRELMEISINANKSSTAKYARMGPAIGPDGRLRGALQFDGAARTRRWAGRNAQFHNLPSRDIPPPEQVDGFIRALKLGLHEELFDDHMRLAAAGLRGTVIAPKGKKLEVADLSNIEGRLVAWLADERWKLKAFEAFDRGEGPDLYKVTAGAILGVPPEDVGKFERNAFGKVSELACGYAGGVGAFQTFANAYGVKMADHWDTLKGTLDPSIIEQAYENIELFSERRGVRDIAYTMGITRSEWLASEATKLAWRGRHPATVALWRAIHEAAESAMEDKEGNRYRAVGKLVFDRNKDWLRIELPSGRFLCYYQPKYVQPIKTDSKTGKQVKDGRPQLTYMGLNQTSRQWERLKTFAGKLLENACQSLGRDVLADNMPLIERAGFEIVLTVHDEIIAERKANRPDGSLARLMARNPEWAKGLPLAAAGFSTGRYRKEA